LAKNKKDVHKGELIPDIPQRVIEVCEEVLTITGSAARLPNRYVID
jgi:hypothetical protein